MTVKVNIPKHSLDEIRRQKLPYRTLDFSTGRISVAPVNEIEKALTAYKELILQKSRTVNFGETEEIYKDEKVAEEMAGGKLLSEKWVLFSSYTEMRIVRIRVGRIPPLIRSECDLATLLNKIGKGQLVRVMQKHRIDW